MRDKVKLYMKRGAQCMVTRAGSLELLGWEVCVYRGKG